MFRNQKQQQSHIKVEISGRGTANTKGLDPKGEGDRRETERHPYNRRHTLKLIDVKSLYLLET